MNSERFFTLHPAATRTKTCAIVSDLKEIELTEPDGNTKLYSSFNITFLGDMKDLR
jgi:hypothetical protein